MKTKYVDFKWNGIPLFGKRYGRYNLLAVFLVANILILFLYAVSLSFFTKPLGEISRSVLIGIYCGSTLVVSNFINYTNALLIASPKLCVLFLRAMKSKLVLIESTNTCLKYKKATEEDSYVYTFDVQRNIIWIE